MAFNANCIASNKPIIKCCSVCGCIAVFKGRECLHRVPALNKPQFRVTIPMNYYFEDDVWRPEWVDEAIYLNKDYVSA